MPTAAEISISSEQRVSGSQKRILRLAGLAIAGVFGICLSRPGTFGAYWVSGWAASRDLDPYGTYSLVGQSVVASRGETHAISDINMNPPCLLPLFQLLAHFGLNGFAAIWTVISAVCLAASVSLVMRERPNIGDGPLAWLCVSSAVIDTAISGQIYFLLMLLATSAIVALQRRRDLLASINMGLLIAIKPTFIFWPMFIAAAGRWRLAARSVAVSALVWMAAWGAYGSGVYASWIRAVRMTATGWYRATSRCQHGWRASVIRVSA